MKKLLTIAGSDSGGGAGIQADIKTFSALGCYAMSVITAVTAQNTVAVTDSQDIRPDIIEKQLAAVFTDLPPDGVKVGMVSVPETIAVIADALERYRPEVVVIDPVMVSKSGFPLLRPQAVEAMKRRLLPLAGMLTPNIPEAELLCGMEIRTREDMERAARRLGEMGAEAVLLKGGHRQEDADDLIFAQGRFTWLPGARIDTQNTHGTGCTISSAIAAWMARGADPVEAARRAKAYVTGAIAHALDIGQGCGPTNHFWEIFPGENRTKRTEGKDT